MLKGTINICISVLHDIVATMLNERFVEELFKPQRLSNRHALRTLFDNLAHVSIMRLNRTSMNKVTTTDFIEYY